MGKLAQALWVVFTGMRSSKSLSSSLLYWPWNHSPFHALLKVPSLVESEASKRQKWAELLSEQSLESRQAAQLGPLGTDHRSRDRSGGWASLLGTPLLSALGEIISLVLAAFVVISASCWDERAREHRGAWESLKEATSPQLWEAQTEKTDFKTKKTLSETKARSFIMRRWSKHH